MGFQVNLTVEAEQGADLAAKITEPKKKLFRDVLPLLDAREIMESEPGED